MKNYVNKISCQRPKLIQMLKANHNDCGFDSATGMVVKDLS